MTTIFFDNFITYLDSQDDIDDDEFQHEVTYILDRMVATKSIPYCSGDI